MKMIRNDYLTKSTFSWNIHSWRPQRECGFFRIYFSHRSKNQQNICPHCVHNATYSILVLYIHFLCIKLLYKYNITLEVTLLYRIVQLWLAQPSVFCMWLTHSCADIHYSSMTLSVTLLKCTQVWDLAAPNLPAQWNTRTEIHSQSSVNL